jgi:hypothetical protein
MAGSPYLVCGTTQATLVQGATLTIEPGVTVEFETNSRLNIQGTLIALGASDQPINFTSSNPTPGSWAGLNIHNFGAQPALASLDFVEIEYGGYNSSTGAALFIDNGVVTMTNSIIQSGAGYGIYVADDLHPVISDIQILDNGKDAIRLTGARDDLKFTNLTATGNNENVIRVGGYSDMQGDRRWQAAGIPYVFIGGAGNGPGDRLTVDPGVEARFGSNLGLEIGGALSAVGLPDQPITFTAITPTPGFWTGIRVSGTSASAATAVLEYTTLEYGGSGFSGANLFVNAGQVQVRYSTIRNSGNDGIRNQDYGRSRSVVELTQLIDNVAIDLNNLEPEWPILAINNWWGDPNGPTLPAGSPCGPGGNGSEISDGVIFRPALPSPDAAPLPPAADDFRMLSITPRRWFAPATGIDRVYIEITLRDGQGMPIPGRTVRLGSTLGQVVDGGITGANGTTLAYLTSTTAGDAEINAILETQGACELVRSPVATITFTPAGPDQGYLPPEASPYLNDGIHIDPMPIIQGVPTRLSVKVTNPNDYPIIVDAWYNYFQTNIGLTFGPLAEILGTTIPANGETEIDTIWVPPISGSYCIQFEYTAREGSAMVLAPNASGKTRINPRTRPGNKHNEEVMKAYQTSRKAVEAMGNANDALTLATSPADFIAGSIPGQLFGHMMDSIYDLMDKIDKALTGDPPRQDYQLISQPVPISFTPLEPGSDVSPAKAAAVNAYVSAAAEMYSVLRAATIANDRLGGASAANDLDWVPLQYAAVMQYEYEAALIMPEVADLADAYVAVLLQENPDDIIMTADIYAAYQQRLATEGFNEDEIAAARLIGMTNAEIATLLQERLAADPEKMAGSVTERIKLFAQTLRRLSYAILYPPAPVFSVSGGLNINAASSTAMVANNLARTFADETTILVGNPHSQPETIELRIRPIDLPPDWLVTITPGSALLDPGESISVTVRTVPGSPTTQGSRVRFAVEGYIGSELIGGVVFDTLIPEYVPFDGTLRTYLPIISQK